MQNLIEYFQSHDLVSLVRKKSFQDLRANDHEQIYDKAARIVADGVSESLKTRPAVFEWELLEAIKIFGNSEQENGRKINFHGVHFYSNNPYLMKPAVFFRRRLDIVLRDVIYDMHKRKDFGLKCILPYGVMCPTVTRSSVYYQSEELLKNFLAQRFKKKVNVVFEFSLSDIK